jgi:hypothetical protein
VLSWVARLSSRIFNGDQLARDEEWLRISKEYTVSSFEAVTACKKYSVPFRWFAERTLPICRKVRADRKAGAKLLAPILAERKAEIAAAQREGREPNVSDTRFFNPPLPLLNKFSLISLNAACARNINHRYLPTQILLKTRFLILTVPSSLMIR